MISREAESFGPDFAEFVGKAQDVATNDGVRLSLVEAPNREMVTLGIRGGELGSRPRNLIASLGRSYGVEVNFVLKTKSGTEVRAGLAKPRSTDSP